MKKYFNESPSEISTEIDEIFENIKKNIEKDDFQKADEDIRSVEKLLENLDMDEDMQWGIVYKIEELTSFLEKRDFRDIFRRFLDYLENEYYLSTDIIKYACTCAMAALQSYEFCDDEKADLFLQNEIPAIADAFYYLAAESKRDDSEFQKLTKDSLIRRWALCRYFLNHRDDFFYLKNNYKELYASISLQVDDMMADELKSENDIRDNLINIISKENDSNDIDIENIDNILLENYGQMLKVSFGDGENEADMWRSLRPNDRCLCGSGKKYKKCHGRR